MSFSEANAPFKPVLQVYEHFTITHWILIYQSTIAVILATQAANPGFMRRINAYLIILQTLLSTLNNIIRYQFINLKVTKIFSFALQKHDIEQKLMLIDFYSLCSNIVQSEITPVLTVWHMSGSTTSSSYPKESYG